MASASTHSSGYAATWEESQKDKERTVYSERYERFTDAFTEEEEPQRVFEQFVSDGQRERDGAIRRCTRTESGKVDGEIQDLQSEKAEKEQREKVKRGHKYSM